MTSSKSIPQQDRPVRLVKTNEPALLPQNEAAEAGVLGSILIDPDALTGVRAILAPEHFYVEDNRLVCQYAYELFDQGIVPDLITLPDALERSGKMDGDHARAVVSALGNHVPSSANVLAYAQIVKRDYLKRELIRVGGEIAGVAYRDDDVQGALAYTKSLVEQIADDAGPTEPRFKLKSIQDLRKRPRPQWLIPGILQERKLGTVFGDSNTGKSFGVLDWGLCWATETEWNGHKMPGGHVVYVCAEGLDGISARVDAWLLAHGIEDAPNFHIIDESPNLLEQGDVDEVIAQVNDLPSAPVAVIFDTLAMSMPGGKENEEDMGVAVMAMKRVQNECETAVVAVHHSGKDSSKGPRGNSSLRAAMDTVVEVLRDQDSNIVTMRCNKQKDAAYFRDINFDLRVISLDEYGDETSCVLVPTDAPTPEPKKHSKKMTAADRLFVLMSERGQPAYHAELKRAFVERYDMSPRSFDNARDELERGGKIENVNGMWRVKVEA